MDAAPSNARSVAALADRTSVSPGMPTRTAGAPLRLVLSPLPLLAACAQNCQLARHIAWPTQRHAERMFDRRYPRGTCAGCQLGNHRQRDGTESCCLDLTLYQSNGPAAHRSNRDQHHYVNMLLAKLPYDAGHALSQQPLRPKRVANI